ESLREMKSTASISEREREIIRLIADEFTTKEIAEQLHLSPHTIESHRQNIMLKLGAKNSAGLVKYAIQKGLI
ncbi:MAG: LuxR C-terminal-related transcriptional regulator, partial [Saprospiraceae bacterium]|nr:LuxR C-terminal-related transcriptional regulator [Saprospiraceae bacterium]